MCAEDGRKVTTDDKEIVSALRTALAERVGAERFALWFGSSARITFDGQTLSFGVPNQFFLDWIRVNFRQQIEEACRCVLRDVPPLSFYVHSTLCETRGQQPLPAKTAGGSGQSGAGLKILPAGNQQQDSQDPEPVGSLPRRRFGPLESFVQGQSNRLAFASAQMAAATPGKLTPLLIHGPTSVGKTHLLEGIWRSARKACHGITAIYLTAEQFTTYFLEALRGGGLPNFRRKYRGVGLLIIDDLQFLAGKRATQIELLHTIDTLLRERRQLVFSADRPPAELAELGPELTTRLEGGMVCGIDPPDHNTRLGIVAQMARRTKLHVPEDVQQFIASRLTSHARELSGALCRLQATAEALGRPITLPMAEEALAEMIRNSGKVVRLGDIERAVCDVFGLEPTSLHSKRKTKSVSHPRMLAMWLARKHTRAALSEIGHFFGRRSHSTVISAQKRVDRWMAAGGSLQTAERHWNVDEAIRKVERHLAAG